MVRTEKPCKKKEKANGQTSRANQLYLWMDEKQAETLAALMFRMFLRYCNQIWYHEMPIVDTEARGSD